MCGTHTHQVSASLNRAIHTKCLSTLCTKHKCLCTLCSTPTDHSTLYTMQRGSLCTVQYKKVPLLMCITQKVPLWTVQYKHRSSLASAGHSAWLFQSSVVTQCLSTLWSSHTFLLYIMQYTQFSTLHCALHTQRISWVCNTEEVPFFNLHYTHCLPKLCSTHTVHHWTVQFTHIVYLECALHTR